MSSRPGPLAGTVRYGRDVPPESELRILGSVEGMRVLELGSGSRSSAVALAARGAHVIVVDPHPERLGVARVAAEDAEVRAEWHESELSELAFLRADSIDVAFSAGAVSEVADLGRLFRQVHRVLRPGGAFVFSEAHPIATAATGRPYWDDEPVIEHVDGVEVTVHPRPVSDVSTALLRSGYRIEMIAEPRPVSGASAPTTIIWKARKEGA